MPVSTPGVIRLGHGSGGKLSAELLADVFLPELGNDVLSRLDDAACVDAACGKLAITTDSYVVNPIFFPGGDIGRLAVYGTINDLAMRGARPIYLTAAFILEEGLSIDELRRVVRSMRLACETAGVLLVAGDTKVVNKGAADKLFITTSGVGIIERADVPAGDRASAGDIVIASGQLGLHGMAIMCAREGLELETEIESDSEPLHELVREMLEAVPAIHCLRDLTRGGLSSACNELAEASGVGIEIDEARVPVHPYVKAACEILGLDPLYVACEGRLIAIVPERASDELVKIMRSHPAGRGASVIGRVVADHPGRVVLKSRIGGRRILDRLSGEQLPRIC